jgi:hypothetical protein
MDGREETIIIHWMPSHVDDPKKNDQKQKVLASGLSKKKIFAAMCKRTN